MSRLDAVTLDFGNTLVPVPASGLRGVVQRTAEAIADRLVRCTLEEVLRTWHEERTRQFREEVPRFREADLAARSIRVLARLRGMAPPPDETPWDQDAAAALTTPDEIDWLLDIYSNAFVDALPQAPRADGVLRLLAERYRVAILSNWPLAATIDRYVAVAGWAPWLDAVVVSQRVGVIKPHPGIFAAAREAVGGVDPDRIMHVGDDWAADVVGAHGAGWRSAYLAARPSDSPLPGSARDGRATPDLELAALADLPGALDAWEAAGPSA